MLLDTKENKNVKIKDGCLVATNRVDFLNKLEEQMNKTLTHEEALKTMIDGEEIQQNDNRFRYFDRDFMRYRDSGWCVIHITDYNLKGSAIYREKKKFTLKRHTFIDKNVLLDKMDEEELTIYDTYLSWVDTGYGNSYTLLKTTILEEIEV